MMANARMGYLLHVLFEVPAAINFFLFPSRQLGIHTPQAHAVIRQYALLLLSSVLVALIFAWRPTDKLSGQVAGALALYHLGPVVRSASRIRQYLYQANTLRRGPKSLSEPTLYLVVHVLTGLMLAHTCWTAYLVPDAMNP